MRWRGGGTRTELTTYIGGGTGYELTTWVEGRCTELMFLVPQMWMTLSTVQATEKVEPQPTTAPTLSWPEGNIKTCS
jgi:hypothetical protein